MFLVLKLHQLMLDCQDRNPSYAVQDVSPILGISKVHFYGYQEFKLFQGQVVDTI